MVKLSPHYREDTIDDLPEKLRKFLDLNYVSQLANLTVTNPKILVVFSGGNAVGKTTLSNKISDQLNGLHIENDAIKRQLLKFDPDINRDELNSITWKYSMTLYRRLRELTTNGLIIRDGVIDWYYDRILPIFTAASAQTLRRWMLEGTQVLKKKNSIFF